MQTAVVANTILKKYKFADIMSEKKAYRQNQKRLQAGTTASAAGGTCGAAIIVQRQGSFFSGKYNASSARGLTPQEYKEDCYARATVAFSRSQSFTLFVSPLRMVGDLTVFHPSERQVDRWLISDTPDWSSPPLAISEQIQVRGERSVRRLRLIISHVPKKGDLAQSAHAAIHQKYKCVLRQCLIEFGYAFVGVGLQAGY